MAKYIDAEKLKSTLKKNIYPSSRCGKTFNALLEFVMRLIDDIPAADVVEVVRCKDCAHCVVREYDITDEFECEFFDVFTDPLDYCSRGERKVENG